MKSIVATTLIIAMFALFSVTASYASGVNEIRYPEERWDPILLGKIKAGTTLLSKSAPVSIDPPPANDSDVVKEELAYLRGLKEKRTKDQIEKIHFENGPEMDMMTPFFEVGDLKKRKHASTVRLVKTVVADTTYFLLREKQRYQRARPSQLADDLDLVITNPYHSSYPSGHAGQSYAVALTLAKLDPEHGDAYKQLALDIAWRRELAGVHYPSDSAAGRQIAEQVVAALMENENFQRFYSAAEKEF